MKSPDGGISVIVRAGDYESVHYALALAAAALAVNKPAVLFFTMAGIRALMGRRRRSTIGSATRINRKRGVGDFETLLQACVELGARFIVCEMGLRSLGIDRAGAAHRRSLHGRGHRDLAGRNQAGHAPGHAVEDQSGDFMTSAAFDVLGIGNAIVDVISRADDAFSSKHGLVKGSMMLIDEAARRDALRRDGAGHRGLGRLVRQHHGGRRLVRRQGRLYRQGARRPARRRCSATTSSRSACRSTPSSATSGPATARCLILVTPDAQRTMNTYLGACIGLGPDDIDTKVVGAAQVTYVEGYLWDAPEAKKAVLKAFDAAHAAGRQVSITLSDSFCVDRYRDEFRDLVRNKVDILFGNEAEIKSLYEVETFEEALEATRKEAKIAALTRSEKGSVVIKGSETYAVPAAPVAQGGRHDRRRRSLRLGLPVRLHAAASRSPSARGWAASPPPRSSPMSARGPRQALKV